MKIKEFEKAIDALCAGVTIDEMKLKEYVQYCQEKECETQTKRL